MTLTEQSELLAVVQVGGLRGPPDSAALRVAEHPYWRLCSAVM